MSLLQQDVPHKGTDEEWAVLEEWTKKDKELAWPYCIMAFRIKAGYFKHASFHSQSLIKDNYEKAALLGNPVGMLNLGTLYGNGSHGVGQDLVKARKWWGLVRGQVVVLCCCMRSVHRSQRRTLEKANS